MALRASVPFATLSENTLIQKGQAEHSVVTTCAYCGVCCSFVAEMQGEELVRMVPNKDGHANPPGHSCVKGAFRHRLCTTPFGPHRQAHDPLQDPLGPLARGVLQGGSDRLHAASELKRIQGGVRPRLDRCHYLLTMLPRTRRPTSCRSWCARALATITSIPAPGYAIRPQATDSRTPSASRPARRTSIR